MSVVRLIDGDTVAVRMTDGHTEKVRYLGVDTPEMVHLEKPVEPMDEAAAFNRGLMEAGPLHLELDVQERHQYGRLPACVWARDVFVNCVAPCGAVAREKAVTTSERRL